MHLCVMSTIKAIEERYKEEMKREAGIVNQSTTTSSICIQSHHIRMIQDSSE
jgi:hypothetical protein